MIPLETALPLMITAAERASVPVATQLEHTDDFDTIMRAIRLGVSSVMFDGSHLSYEENVAGTAEVVRAANGAGVAVEAELGAVGGSAVRTQAPIDSLLTDPDVVVDFVARTGVHSLAVSFGNAHGAYAALPELDYDRVRKICSLVDIPIVMHGGSGLTAEQYRQSIESGISDIHCYSAIAARLWDRLDRQRQSPEDRPPYHEIAGHTIDFFCESALEIVDMFGSGGRAVTNRE